MLKRLFYILVCLMITFSCSQKSNSLVSRSYHNVTARYNAYFHAKERMKEVHKKIQDKQTYDYNDIINYYPEIDSNFTKSLDPDFKYIFDFATLPLKRHQNSNWVDDSYIIIADCKHYREKLDSAILIYKYVNTNGTDDNDRHKAVIKLLRAYLAKGDETRAIETFNYLSKQEFNQDNQRDFDLVAFEYFRGLRQTDSMLAHIEPAISDIQKKDDKARAMFITGQLYQAKGENQKALAYYKKVVRKRPPYEMEFNTRVNMAQVADLKDKGTLQKINKYFDKLLVDEKNKEFQDRVYYEKGRFELKQGNTVKGIEFLNKSLHVNGQTKDQSIYSHLLLGKTYYNEMDGKMPNVLRFTKSQQHYDSATTIMKTTFKDYEDIIERKDDLTDFVEQFTIITVNDSLLAMAEMSQEELDAVIGRRKSYEEKLLKEDYERKQELKKKKAREEQLAQQVEVTNSNFVFYNPQSVQTGKFDFKEKWGERKLEDNWRRSEKEIVLEEFKEDSSIVSIVDSLPTKIENDTMRFVVDAQPYYDAVPTEDSEKEALKTENEVAKYKLGKIYKLQLKEEQNALETFKRHLSEYQQSQYTPEILYIMYSSCLSIDTCDQEKYAVRAHNEYPNSIFTKLIDNPNYFKDNESENREAHDIYEKAFYAFKSGQINQSKRYIKQVSTEFPDNDIPDHIELLRVMLYAKTDQMAYYFAGLKKFKEDYPTSDLVSFTETLLGEAEKVGVSRDNLISLSDTSFVPTIDTTSLFLLVLNKNEISFSNGLSILYEFNNTYYDSQINFTTRKVVVNDSLFYVVVKTLPSESFSKEYVKKFDHFLEFRELLKDKYYERYLIDNRNYQVLLNTKKIKEYSEFYDGRKAN